MRFWEYEYGHEFVLWFLLALPLLLVWYIIKVNRNSGNASIKLPSLKGFASLKNSLLASFRHVMFSLRLIAIAALLTALAEPREQVEPEKSETTHTQETEGISIIIAMDISGSMEAVDFTPNRLEAAKMLAMEFVESRPNDRIGLVVYEGASFTQCPLTTDHKILLERFADVESGLVVDGTAIGDGLSTATNRLVESESESKVIILLTDGENNSGSIDPVIAAENAALFGIKVYTIGIGTDKGTAPFVVQGLFGKETRDFKVKLNETILKQIAAKTNGKYFHAKNQKGLGKIYSEIDKLEKTVVKELEYTNYEPPKYDSRYFWFALIGVCLLLGEFLLGNSIFRSVP
jgi:Ca-activated chloride channel family protein